MYFKHDVEASLIIIFIDNPDVDDIGDAILVQTKPQKHFNLQLKVNIGLCGPRYCKRQQGCP